MNIYFRLAAIPISVRLGARCAISAISMRFAVFAAGLLALAGCATAPVSPHSIPQREAIEDDSDRQIPANTLQGTARERIIAIALAQWSLWGGQIVQVNREGETCIIMSSLPVLASAHTEEDELAQSDEADETAEAKQSELLEQPECPDFPDGTGMEATAEGCAMAQNYWHIVGREASCRQITTGSWAWSAVFVSWVLKKSGLDATQFLASDAHSEYIVDARDSALGDPAFRVESLPARPRVGDLICATRSRSTWTVFHVDEIERRTPMHCDIVVEVGERTLKAVGGNVQQSVSMSVVDLNDDGMLESEPGAMRPWLLIMRNQLL